MIFVDTGAWFEAAAGHGEAAEAARGVGRGAPTELATSDAVLVELWHLLQRSGHAHLATLTCADIATTARVLPIDAAVRTRALEVQRTWYDQRFSYADALSFALIERHQIATAVSFDRCRDLWSPPTGPLGSSDAAFLRIQRKAGAEPPPRPVGPRFSCGYGGKPWLSGTTTPSGELPSRDTPASRLAPLVPDRLPHTTPEAGVEHPGQACARRDERRARSRPVDSPDRERLQLAGRRDARPCTDRPEATHGYGEDPGIGR